MNENSNEERKYKKTHPWITFLFKSNNDLNWKSWLLLGEIQSKIEHISGVPLKPNIAEKLLQVYLRKGAIATTAIEGNTLSEEEVDKLLDQDIPLPKSKEYQGIEIKNIIDTFNEITKKIINGNKNKVDYDDILQYNKQILKELDLSPHVVPGELRKESVVVGRYRGAPYEDCPFLLKKLVDWLNSKDFKVPAEEYKTSIPILKAIIAHVYFAWIHPFGDGNGRTARLIEAEILLNANVPQPVAHLLSNHYNQTRSDYYRYLAKTSQANDLLSFINYALQGLLDGIKGQLDEIKTQVLKITWINYIYEQFENKNSKAQVRRRQIALDLTKHSAPKTATDIFLLSPKLAGMYKGKSSRIVYSDLRALMKMELIVFDKTKTGLIANINRMRAFLPTSKLPHDSIK